MEPLPEYEILRQINVYVMSLFVWVDRMTVSLGTHECMHSIYIFCL